MCGGGGVGRPPLATSWRALATAALAMWLMPVVLALALLWLPPLCCAVAAVRFQRVRRLRRRMRACGGAGGRAGGSFSCLRGDGTVDAGDRTRLLHRYLHDQMELVVAGADAEELELHVDLTTAN